MKSTYTLLLELFNQVSKSFTAESVSDNNDGTYTLFSCNTLWIHLVNNKPLVISGKEYYVKDMLPNQWVILQGPVPSDINDFLIPFDIYPFFPFSGTALAQNEQLSLYSNSKDKLPMAWVHSAIVDRSGFNEMLLKDRDSDVDIYFMTDANFEDWLQPEHLRYAVQPMINLANAFIDVLGEAPNVGRSFNYQIQERSKFGKYDDGRGNPIMLFGDEMSGCMLRITIPFLQDYSCCN